MAVYEFSKRPWEEYPAVITFTNDDGVTTYTVSSVAVIVTDSAGLDVSSTINDTLLNSVSSNKAAIWLKGGTDGEVYDIEARATMSSGQKIAKRLRMTVTEQEA